MNLLPLLLVLLSSTSSFAQTQDPCVEKLRNGVFVTINGNTKQTHDPIYVEPIIQAYLLYPQPIQKYLCQVGKFRIEDMDASAYSDFSFRKGLFDKQLSTPHWATWKEQLNFGAKNDDNFQITNKLPYIVSSLPEKTSFLYYMLIHEIGHNIETSGIEQAWQPLYDLPINSFKNKDKLCSYWCTNPQWAWSDIIQLYKDIYLTSNYVTLYASRNPAEDFADTFTFFVALGFSKADYKVIIPNGFNNIELDVRTKMNSPLMKDKIAILKKVYSAMAAGQLRPKRGYFRIIKE